MLFAVPLIFSPRILSSKQDTDGDKEIDALLVFHSGYASEFGVDCTNDRPGEDRFFSQGHAASPEGGWVSSDATGNYKLSGYSLAAGLLGRCNANYQKMGVPTHE